MARESVIGKREMLSEIVQNALPQKENTRINILVVGVNNCYAIKTVEKMGNHLVHIF